VHARQLCRLCVGRIYWYRPTIHVHARLCLRLIVRWQRPDFWPNLAMTGNNRFSAFFSSLYHAVQESVGWTDDIDHLLAFSKFKMASKMVQCRFSGSDSSESIWRIFKKNLHSWDVGDFTRHANVGVNRFKGGMPHVCTCMKLSPSSRDTRKTCFKRLFFRPPVRSNGRTYKMLVMFFFFFNA